MYGVIKVHYIIAMYVLYYYCINYTYLQSVEYGMIDSTARKEKGETQNRLAPTHQQ